MLNGINIEEIKRYNEGLKAHTERAAKIKAELDINTNELNRLCAELTQELGVQVTTENLESIYNENVAKINNTLQTGNEILRRIAEEEMALTNPQVAITQPEVNVGVQPTVGVYTGQNDVMGGQPVAPPQFQTFIPNPAAFGGVAQNNESIDLPPLSGTITI